MKRVLIILLSIIAFSGCNITTEVVLTATAVSGAPGITIDFDASKSEVGGSESLQYCEFTVLQGDVELEKSDGVSKAENEEGFGLFSYRFANSGTFTVTATISDASWDDNVDFLDVNWKDAVIISSKSIDIVISKNFINANLNIGFEQMFADNGFTLSAIGLDVSAVKKQIWKVYNSSDTWSSTNKDFLITNGIPALGIYNVELTLIDESGFAKTISTTFKIIQPNNPTAIASVSLVADGFTTLDASASKATSDSSGTIISYNWYIYTYEGSGGFDFEIGHIEKNSGASFSHSVGTLDAGKYEVVLVVENQNGLIDSTSRIPLVIEPNDFVISSVDFTETLYEGEECTIDLTLADNYTDIVDIIMDFDDSEIDDIAFDSEDLASLGSFSWTPDYMEDINDVIYTGHFFIVDSEGNWSTGLAFSKTVLDIAPIANFTVDFAEVNCGDTINLDASTCEFFNGAAAATAYSYKWVVKDSSDAIVAQSIETVSTWDFSLIIAGNYTVELVVIDDAGTDSAVLIKSVVFLTTLTADAIGYESNDLNDPVTLDVANDDTYSFSIVADSVNGTDTLSYEWEMDDGSGFAAFDDYEAHIFGLDGTYNIKVEITNDVSGEILTKDYEITIGEE